jgi:general secretion pathway protein B
MSFILEALKRSEQERALGQVPRIHTNLLIEEPPASRPNPWVLLAVGLAFLAVAIALYAALRAPVPSPAISPAPDMLAEGRSSSPPAAVVGAQPAQAVVTEEQRYGPLAPGAEPPARPSPPPPEVVATAPRPMVASPPIPADLVEDIASFKEQLRHEQGLGVGSSDQPAATPESGAGTTPADDPRQRRLPEALQAGLPAFRVTAHVYDPQPPRRFIVINSLRYGEGERTREGFEVLEILPDGVLLGYQGHSFFARR